MLGKFLKINGETIPNPKEGGFSISPGFVENVNTSEAATDLVTVVRTSKPVFNMNFQLSSTWKAKLDAYSKLLSVTLTYNGQNYTGRLRAGSQSLVGNSAHTENTDGLWNCAYTFTTI